MSSEIRILDFSTPCMVLSLDEKSEINISLNILGWNLVELWTQYFHVLCLFKKLEQLHKTVRKTVFFFFIEICFILQKNQNQKKGTYFESDVLAALFQRICKMVLILIGVQTNWS